MYTIKVYQLDWEKYGIPHHVAGSDKEFVESMELRFHKEQYELIYRGPVHGIGFNPNPWAHREEISQKLLERIWRVFNHQDKLFDPCVNERSLSIGDVVEFDGEYWVCCTAGWKPFLQLKPPLSPDN